MGMFNSMRKPRGFNHQYIYVDERKEKLAKMEENAKRDLGMLPEKEFTRSPARRTACNRSMRKAATCCAARRWAYIRARWR